MKLSAVEAFKTALNVEVIGEGFYTEVAKKSTNPRAKEMFNKLAADEKAHQSDFMNIINNISGMKEEIERFSDSEEIDGYLNAVMKTNIFKSTTSIKKLINDVKNDRDALKIGIEAEKTSILYYNALLKIFDNTMVQDIFSKVLAEERKHLQELVDLLEERR